MGKGSGPFPCALLYTRDTATILGRHIFHDAFQHDIAIAAGTFSHGHLKTGEGLEIDLQPEVYLASSGRAPISEAVVHAQGVDFIGDTFRSRPSRLSE